MNVDQPTTLKFSATIKFNAAEANIKAAQTYPKMTATSGTNAMAMGGR